MEVITLCGKCTNTHVFFLFEDGVPTHSICFVCKEIDSAIQDCRMIDKS